MVIADEGDRYRYANVRLSPEPALLARLSPWIAALGAPYAQPQDVRWDVAFKFGPEAANREIAEAAWQAPGLAFFRWFAEAPLTVEITHRPAGPCVWFQDLRFLTPGREAWPFRYGACRRDGGPWRAFGWNGGEPLAID